MNLFDQAVPSLGALLAGNGGEQQPQQPAQAPAQTPGLMDGARNWLQSNPAMTSMLLGTMMAAARGHDFGNSVAEGARFSLTNQAEMEQRRRQDEEKAQARADKDREFGLKERQVTGQERMQNSQIAENEQQMAERAELRPFNVEKAKKSLAQIDAEIARTTSATKREALLQKKAELEIRLEEQFGADERRAGIAARRASAGASAAAAEASRASAAANRERATGEALDNRMKAADVADWENTLPEERKQLRFGSKGKAPKTEQEQFMDFLAKNGDVYSGPNGDSMDWQKALQDFKAIKTKTDPVANAASIKERQARFDAAKNSVPVGGLFTFEGKSWRRDQ